MLRFYNKTHLFVSLDAPHPETPEVFLPPLQLLPSLQRTESLSGAASYQRKLTQEKLLQNEVVAVTFCFQSSLPVQPQIDHLLVGLLPPLQPWFLITKKGRAREKVHATDRKAAARKCATEPRAQEMPFQLCACPTRAIHTAEVAQRHRTDINTMQST